MQRRAFVLCFVIFLSACSGGGDSSSPPPSSTPPVASATSPEGLWNGTTSTGRSFGGLILDDGSYWFLYSVIGSPNVVAGVVQGNETSQNGSFTSSDAKDFNLEGLGVLNATLVGTYVMKQTLNGTIAYQIGQQATFTGVYDANYELTPDMNAVAGTYSGMTPTNETVTVTLTAAGEISGSSSSGCSFLGSFVPRANGNVFNVVVTFGGGVCANGTNTVKGVAHFDAATNILRSAALDSSRTNGFLFIGSKP